MSGKPGANPRSVLFLISNLGLGGAERQLVYLATGLKERGWGVRIASLTPLFDPSFARQLERAQIPVEIMQAGMEARIGALATAVRGLLRLVRDSKPSIIVGFMPHGALLARLLGRFSGVPKIVTSLRNIKSTHRWHDWLLAMTRALDDASVTNSAVAAKAQLRAGVTSPAKSIVIHNGFDLSRVLEAGDGMARGGSETDFVWLNIAVFRREKDHATLLAAARELARTRRFKLLFAGEGPLLEQTKDEARKLGLSGHVQFLGWRSEVAELIRSADAFVLSSLWEGLPNVLIEALADGLPVVSTDVGGCREVVQDGVSGLLVPPADPGKIADAMLRIMDMTQEERARMGAAGRQHVLSSFSMEQMVDRWEGVISGGSQAAAGDRREKA